MEVTPPLSDVKTRQQLEDEIRRAVRAVTAEVGVIVLSYKSATRVVLIDLQPDLLGDSQEKLSHVAHTILGFRDAADPLIGRSKRSRGSSRVRQALVSRSGGGSITHTLAYKDYTFTGETKALKVRMITRDTAVVSEHTIVGISRNPALSLQVRDRNGRHYWASLKTGDFDPQEFRRLLDKHFPQYLVDISVVRDNAKGFEIKAAELDVALGKEKSQRPLLPTEN